MGILAVLLAVTGALVWATRTASADNESRLLKLQVAQAAAALAGELPSIRTTLEAAQELATVTKADPTRFKSFIAPYVGPGSSFASVSLWKLGGASPRPLVVAGAAPDLGARPGEAAAFFAKVRPSSALRVTSILSSPERRLGFAELPPAATTGLVVYAETALPADAKLTVPPRSAFSDLNFALYLGRLERPRYLIESSVPLPISGLHSSTTVDFGDTAITLLASPRRLLGGKLLTSLAWLVGILGVVLALIAALIAERLVRRRKLAEGLAVENRRLYAEQRDVARTLQHALLPAALPVMEGIEVAARYVAGVEGIDVGGDWYDVIRIDDDRWFFVVGDVSGRGLAAATTMASLRYAIRAYVIQEDRSEVVLEKLDQCLEIARDGHFATVLCGVIDVPARRVTLANAGHLPALMIAGGSSDFIQGPVDPPIGVQVPVRRSPPVGVSVPEGAAVLCVTDGLVERRGEGIDTGLERLRQIAASSTGSLEQRLSQVLDGLTPRGSDDDIAMLAIQWRQ